MEVFLRGLLPRLLGDLPFDIHPFQDKGDMLSKLSDRLRGYAAWLPETHRLVIIVDRDLDDCQELKRQLETYALDADLATRSHPRGGRFTVINRIAIEELEAWYFGDWQAVRAAYPRVPETVDRRARFRDPDRIQGGTWEAFEQVLQRAGYFKTGLRKREAARAIAPHLDDVHNRSHSFQVFREAVLELRAQGPATGV
jgi:hypothetical protein